jgi:hypothetical protein
MIAQARELRAGDILITECGDEWQVDSVESLRDGVQVHVGGEPLPWLFSHNELVCFARAETAS